MKRIFKTYWSSKCWSDGISVSFHSPFHWCQSLKIEDFHICFSHSWSEEYNTAFCWQFYRRSLSGIET